MNDENFYKILGIQKSAEAGEIKKAYRKLARQYHPDKNKTDSGAEEKFKKISAAYAVLGDKEKKKLYDQFGINGLRDGFDPSVWKNYSSSHRGPFQSHPHAHGNVNFGGFSGFGSLEDIFENLFGGNPGNSQRMHTGFGFPQKGADIKSTINIELMDAILGSEIQILVPVNSKKKKLKVKIPEGVGNKQTIRLKAQGEPGKNNGSAGDLLLEIVIKKDKNYIVDGLNLIKDININIFQAYRGEKLPVNTPWGEVIIKIPPFTQGGQKFRIKNHGIRTKNKNGDLYIKVNIIIPKNKNNKILAAMENLETAMTE